MSAAPCGVADVFLYIAETVFSFVIYRVNNFVVPLSFFTFVD